MIEHNDSTQVVESNSRGYMGMFRPGFRADRTIQYLPDSLIIPESEWKDRSSEMAAKESRLSDIMKMAKVPVLDQKNTNFCWSFATVAAAMAVRALQNQKNVVLSPASVACPVTNFKNNGGWGEDAIRRIAEYGAVPSSLWPNTAIDRRYDNPHNWEEAKSYKVSEWYRLQPDSIEQVVSLLLRRIPVSAGYNWWGHQVLLVDAFYQANGSLAILARNSWGDISGYPDGWFVLSGKKMIPNDAVAPRVVLAS